MHNWMARSAHGFIAKHFASEPHTNNRASASAGHVSLVGAGPGDPDLITRKGWKAIQAADVVVYDALVSHELMSEIPMQIKRHYVGKLKGRHSASQQDICSIICDYARQGLRVARLKGGDSVIFGRLGEELAALREAGISHNIVPGITAASGCAASLGFSLTERGIASRLRMVTAHSHDNSAINWKDLAECRDTLVFYMGLSLAPTIAQQLMENGLPKDYPALLVQGATTENQVTRTCVLSTLAATAKSMQSPTLIVIGPVTQSADILGQLTHEPRARQVSAID